MKNKEWAQLYAKASTNKTKTWKIEVEELDDGTANIITHHGYIDGNLTRAEKTIYTGKNIGKANETTPFEQACLDAESKFTKKQDKGYSSNIEEEDTAIRPMLAHKFTEREHNIEYPCYSQQKLNGVRCISFLRDGEVVLLSRGGKEYEFQSHLRPQIKHIIEEVGIKGLYLDGELWKRNVPLQDISRATCKQKGNTDRGAELELEYWIYDCFDLNNPEWTFQERMIAIQPVITQMHIDEKTGHQIPGIYTRWVYTSMKHNRKQLMEEHQRHLDAGEEGTIVRNINSAYNIGHRSKDLQKIKAFNDAEYKIVGAFEGTGTEAGLVNWICELPDGRTFKVRPRGSFKDRKEQWENWKDYIGKMLTVQYQEMTNDNIPHICVGISIRDYE